jgi:thioredoxin-like negative regulator of GroEL
MQVDTEEEGDLAGQLAIQALPTLIFIPAAKDKRAQRVEGLLPAETIKKIILEEC